jgi:hypothetical protein
MISLGVLSCYFTTDKSVQVTLRNDSIDVTSVHVTLELAVLKSRLCMLLKTDSAEAMSMHVTLEFTVLKPRLWMLP